MTSCKVCTLQRPETAHGNMRKCVATSCSPFLITPALEASLFYAKFSETDTVHTHALLFFNRPYSPTAIRRLLNDDKAEIHVVQSSVEELRTCLTGREIGVWVNKKKNTTWVQARTDAVYETISTDTKDVPLELSTIVHADADMYEKLYSVVPDAGSYVWKHIGETTYYLHRQKEGLCIFCHMRGVCGKSVNTRHTDGSVVLRYYVQEDKGKAEITCSHHYKTATVGCQIYTT